MPHTSWIERVGKKQIDWRKELDELRQKRALEGHPPPEEPPAGFRQSDLSRFESLFPEFRTTATREGLATGRPFNPFRKAPALVDVPLREPPIETGASERVTSGGLVLPLEPAKEKEKELTFNDNPTHWLWKRKLLPDFMFSSSNAQQAIRRGEQGLSAEQVNLTEATRREEFANSPNPIIRMANTPTVIGGLSPAEMVGLGLLAYGGYQGIRSIPAITRDVANKTLQRALDAGLDKWIAQRSRGVPPSQFKTIQNFLYNTLVQDKTWLQQKATENMLLRQGKTPNVATAARQAVADTITEFDTRLPTLIPRGTQTGAMAFGGLPAKFGSETTWVAMSVAQRVAMAQQAGLSGQVGSKSWADLTTTEQQALARQPVSAVTVPEITPPASVTPEITKSKKDIPALREEGTLSRYDLQSQQEWLGKGTRYAVPVPKDGNLTIYRATPTGETIKAGDYVTTSKLYAEEHIRSNLGGKGKIVSIQATLDDLAPADAPNEFWYAPESAPPTTETITPVTPKLELRKEQPNVSVIYRNGEPIGNFQYERVGKDKQGVNLRFVDPQTGARKEIHFVGATEESIDRSWERLVKQHIPELKLAIPNAAAGEPEAGLQKVTDEFYALGQKQGESNPSFISVKGKAVKIPGYEGYDFFIHRPLSPEGQTTTGWVITEGKTGLKIIERYADTQKEAISQAVANLDKAGGKTKLDTLISGVRETSPRYKIPEAITPPAEVAPAAPQAKKKPITEATRGIPPTEPPVAETSMPEPTPPSGRPRTLADLNREAKGMRALSPEDRAAVMDVAKPIQEDELLYKVKPFSEHADNLLQPDTPIQKALRSVPGVKQVVGAWNPAQMQRANPIAMIGVRKAIFEEIEIGRARLATLNWWHDADELFGFKKVKGKWRATNIKLSKSAEPTKPYHVTIHDLVEHPENYILTPEQEKVLQIAQDMQHQILRDAQRVGVDAVELTGDYWRRIVTKAPGDKLFGGSVKSRITQRKGYTRQRAFDFVDDGAKLGFEYETHPLTALQNRLEAGIRTISDQNARKAIASLPGVEKPLERLESRYPQTMEGIKTARQARDAAKQVFLRDKTVENETALRQAEADYITAMREVYFKKIEASQPSIGELKLPNGRIAPAELVEEVRKWIDLPEITTSKGQITNATLAVTQLLRSTLTNVDLAAGFIQGQALFYRNNVAWWRGQGNALVSLLDDPTAYVAKNFDVMDEGMRMGAISIPTEFLFTRQGLASIPTRIPVVGTVMKSFNRAFEWFIITGQTELYKATRSGVIKRAGGNEQKAQEALVSLGSSIRKELGTESYAILGVRPTQHTIEQLTLFAARFFRALTGFQAQAFTGGEGGSEARKAMGALIAGGLALLVGVSYLKDKKMPNLTDPFAPDWMQVQIGRTYFNPFGPFYPYFRTQARVSILFAQEKLPEAFKQIGYFLKSKAGIPYRAIDMAGQFAFYGSYRTFEGKKLPATPLGIGEAILGEMAVPISIQEAMQAIPEGRPESLVGEIVGLVGREVRPFSAKDFEEYNQIPSNPDELKAALRDKTVQFSREEYRKRNPEVDAKLFISGQVSTVKTTKAYQAVLRIIGEEKINPKDISAVIAWQKAEQKRQELGVKDTDITLTDRLIQQILTGKAGAGQAPALQKQPALEKKEPTLKKKNPFRD